MPKVLIADKSEQYQKLITQSLINHDLIFVRTVEDAIAEIKAQVFDCVLIDMNFPELSRLLLLHEVLKTERYEKTPVLCMGEGADISERVAILDMGAADFIAKPFNNLEFRARVDNKIKKSIKSRVDSQVTEIGNMSIDHTRHRVMVHDGQTELEVPVTQTEFKLLTCLARLPEQVYSREQLLASAWGDESGVLERVVDVHICLLRKKLGHRCSHTVKALSGVGYKLTINRKISIGA
ncbi:MAG: response regulator transcription factor [Bdellovibrionota bacterium]